MVAQCSIPAGSLVRVINHLGQLIGTGILTEPLHEYTPGPGSPPMTPAVSSPTVPWCRKTISVFEILFTPDLKHKINPPGLFLFPSNFFTVVLVEEDNNDK